MYIMIYNKHLYINLYIMRDVDCIFCSSRSTCSSRCFSFHLIDVPQVRLSLATAHMMCLEPEDSQKYIDEGLPLAQRAGLK